jgi:hypothetical protein
MDDFSPLWWLNETSNDLSSPYDAHNILTSSNLLDDMANGDLRRCYSENHLMSFESAEVQAALVSPPT